MYNRIAGFVALVAAVGILIGGGYGCTKATEPAEDEAVVEEEVQVEEVAPPQAPEAAPAEETE